MIANFGAAIGSAIAAAVWGHEMPKNLTKQLGGLLTPAQIQAIYNSITKARTQPDNVRTGVIKAYNDTVVHLYISALVVSLLTIGAALFTRKYLIWRYGVHGGMLTDSYCIRSFRLDNRQNAVEDKVVIGFDHQGDLDLEKEMAGNEKEASN